MTERIHTRLGLATPIGFNQSTLYWPSLTQSNLTEHLGTCSHGYISFMTVFAIVQGHNPIQIHMHWIWTVIGQLYVSICYQMQKKLHSRGSLHRSLLSVHVRKCRKVTHMIFPKIYAAWISLYRSLKHADCWPFSVLKVDNYCNVAIYKWINK